jgi:hypothetical protein
MMFESVKTGDVVTRMLAGVIPCELNVTDVDDKLIHCGPWTFDRVTGAEVDEDLGWGPGPGQHTGSFLTWKPVKVAKDEDPA